MRAASINETDKAVSDDEKKQKTEMDIYGKYGDILSAAIFQKADRRGASCCFRDIVGLCDRRTCMESRQQVQICKGVCPGGRYAYDDRVFCSACEWGAAASPAGQTGYFGHT